MCVTPSIAKADPVVDDAVAQLADLNIGTLTGMPSGRTTYRTTDEFNAELDALAATYPTQVVVKDAPYKSIQGRTIKYVEITNNAAAVGDGKPVFFNMGGIHGNETPGAEDSLEFAYDVLLQAKTNPKVAALLDKVRLIDLPLTNPDGHAFKNATTGAAAPRRASCGPFGAIVPPATCTTPRASTSTATIRTAGARTSASPWPLAAAARAPSPRSRTRWTSCSRTRS